MHHVGGARVSQRAAPVLFAALSGTGASDDGNICRFVHVPYWLEMQQGKAWRQYVWRLFALVAWLNVAWHLTV